MIELQNTTICPSFTIHKTGIEFTGDLTYEEWLNLVQLLDAADKGVHWCIGDTLNYGEKKPWGEKYKEAVEKTGFVYDTLAKDKYVSSKIDFWRRRQNLSYGHHVEVAPYEPHEQDLLLDAAEKQKLSIKQLREQKESILHPPKVVKRGQTWQLGQHTLYCGDSSSEQFQTLLKDSNVSFAFADPPYNAGVASWDTGFIWQHDYLMDIASIVAVTPGIASIDSFMRTKKMPYKWELSYWIDNGMTRVALGFGNHIPVFLFTEGSLFRNEQDIEVWTKTDDFGFEPGGVRISITGGDRDDLKHKGRKPYEMMIHIVELFSKQDETVVDPFLGTGTTLIACEKLERRCIGAEIEPSFCESIIKRWEKSTEREAKLCQ